MRFEIIACWLVATALLGCRSVGTPPEHTMEPDTSEAVATPAPRRDAEREQCQSELASVSQGEVAPGAPTFEGHRAALLGRARGHAVLWVTEPRSTSDDALPPRAAALRRNLSDTSPYRRLRLLKGSYRHDKATLRALVLRDHYLYSADPTEALALVSRLKLVDLFDELEIWLLRGETLARLVRRQGRWPDYRYAEGAREGQEAKLLLGDRVAARRSDLDDPLHRDVQALAHRTGADRITVQRLTEYGMDAQLRFGKTWVRSLVVSEGARFELRCLDAPEPLRRTVVAWQRADTERRQALAALRAAVTAQVHEALPFDRPRGAEDHFSDGQLRPLWRWAYLTGQHRYEYEEESYPVFDVAGQPAPPQMCVDFVLDSFERASGSWYRPRTKPRERALGTLDFDAHGIENRRGVLSFGEFAEEHSALFGFRRFEGPERIPFGQRERFFGYLVEHADQFRPGDVVAIQGRKQDGYIHQHAILIEDTDPITGMPHALADQMRWPRRRTWEAIMAEAPKRSLYFRARPTPELLRQLVPH
jgi:hypothetical protein